MPWDLLIAKKAERHLDDLPANDRKRIDRAFAGMCSDPYAGDIKFLRGASGLLRLRVGPWRIFYKIEQRTRRVTVVAVTRRTSTTY
jgi:mRNA interferase RelE/StbE